MPFCHKCQTNLPTEAFYKDEFSPCKKCRNSTRRLRDQKPESKIKKQLADAEYYERKKDSVKLTVKKYRDSNKEKIKKRLKEKLSDPTRGLEYRKRRRAYLAEYLRDPNKKLAHNLRNRIKVAIKRGSKAGSAVSDLGCTIPEFKKYIESLWKPGMTWDNWNKTGWHIDHIIPLDSFDLTDPEQFKKACHFTNLQPLWMLENIRKGKSY